MKDSACLHESEAFRAAAGLALRPGGVEATAHALDLCGWLSGSAVADVGCGRGATLRLLAERGYRATGFDLSPEMVAEAAAHSGCAARVAEAERLPVDDGVYDGLVCECVLSLLSRPDAVFREFFRVLKPGGGLLLASIVKETTAESLPTSSQSILPLPPKGGEGRGEGVEHQRASASMHAQPMLRHPPSPTLPPSRGERANTLKTVGGEANSVSSIDVIRSLNAAGFAILHTIVLDRAAAALAAQLVWRGCGRGELAALAGAGYRQWIAVKRGEQP